uniref:hypothetical protein n=1 Tax=Rhizobium meliloti TaxID=382 RepID=UPI00041E127C|nr:hypothetical protein [Sinorhizobium meliloti]
MAIELTLDETALTEGAATPWAAVSCLSAFTFLLVGLEFLPVSLWTPIARDLSVSEGQAGMAITVSGAVAVASSLFGSAFLATGLPGALAILALLLIAPGPFATVTASLLVMWGFFSTPIPVAWNTWMAAIVPGELEAAGGLQVAPIQLAIAGGAFAGGMLFDAAGWWSTFLLAACLLAGSAVLAALAGRPA